MSDPTDEANNPISIRLRPEMRATLREVANRRRINLSGWHGEVVALMDDVDEMARDDHIIWIGGGAT